MTPRTLPHTRPRGVALVEALVAFAILSLAVLAALRWQAVMHLQADISRQRGEATQHAHRFLERWRSFARLEAQGDAPSFADVNTSRDEAEGTGARYTIDRQVRADRTARLKTIALGVTWTDRAGALQELQLASAIDGTLPIHSAALMLPSMPSAAARVHGQAPGTPPDAILLADGRSLWSAAPGRPGASAAVTFVTDPDGRIVLRCHGADLGRAAGTPEPPARSACQPVRGAWLTGHVTLASVGAAGGHGPGRPTDAQALSLRAWAPAGASFTPVCRHVGALTAPAARNERGEPVIRYACAVPAEPGDPRPADRLAITPSFPAASPAGPPAQVCRHPTGLGADGGSEPSSAGQPPQALAHQNFVIVPAGQPCPGGTTSHHNGASADLPLRPP